MIKPILLIRVPVYGELELEEVENAANRVLSNDYHVIVHADSDVSRLEIEIHSVEKAMELSPEKADEIISLMKKKE